MNWEPMLYLTADMIVPAARDEACVPAAPDEACVPAAAAAAVLAPPALAYATAPALRPWRGFMAAVAAHVLVLAAVLSVLKFHKTPAPPDAPDGPAFAVTVLAEPQGSTQPAAPPPQKTPAPAAAPAQPVPKMLAAAAPDVVAKPVTAPSARPPPPPAKTMPPLAPLAPRPAPPAVAQGLKTPPLVARQTAVMGMTRPAKAIKTTTVFYSLYAQQGGVEEGTVELRVEVLPDGEPGQVSIAKSSGFADLDHVALNSMRTSHFQPALKNGIPVASVLALVVRFQLQ